MNKSFLVPPKLRGKYLLVGCTVFEIFLILIFFIIAMIQLNPVLMLVPACIFASSCRLINGEMNIRDYAKLLYKFYAKPQVFGLRGVK